MGSFACPGRAAVSSRIGWVLVAGFCCAGPRPWYAIVAKGLHRVVLGGSPRRLGAVSLGSVRIAVGMPGMQV